MFPKEEGFYNELLQLELAIKFLYDDLFDKASLFKLFICSTDLFNSSYIKLLTYGIVGKTPSNSSTMFRLKPKF